MSTIGKVYIRPAIGWQLINWKELVEYRDLLYFLTIRGIKARYAQSVLGVSWAIIQPLFTTLVFTVIFGKLAKVDSNGMPYALFSFAAMVPWNYFSSTLTESANSLLSNANMINKVYFPRLILPLSAAFSKLLDLLIGLFVLSIFMLYFKVIPTSSLFLLPVFIVMLLCTSLGIGMILSAMSVQYRDVKHALTFVVQLLMYAAPVVYPVSIIPENYRTIYCLNPMVGVIEGFRSAIFGNTFQWQYIALGIPVAVLLFIFGAFYFRKMEKNFADLA
jgi:lipopolysaccharide transport system permease protein